jgi:hypothetical protein
MPDKKTREAVARDKRQGKSASTQAGEYVREEIEHIREGKHGARSTEQAIAIGLSKARRDGIKIPSKAVAKKRASSGAASSRPCVRCVKSHRRRYHASRFQPTPNERRPSDRLLLVRQQLKKRLAPKEQRGVPQLPRRRREHERSLSIKRGSVTKARPVQRISRCRH